MGRRHSRETQPVRLLAHLSVGLAAVGLAAGAAFERLPSKPRFDARPASSPPPAFSERFGEHGGTSIRVRLDPPAPELAPVTEARAEAALPFVAGKRVERCRKRGKLRRCR
jgi:hypothetical protein